MTTNPDPTITVSHRISRTAYHGGDTDKDFCKARYFIDGRRVRFDRYWSLENAPGGVKSCLLTELIKDHNGVQVYRHSTTITFSRCVQTVAVGG